MDVNDLAGGALALAVLLLWLAVRRGRSKNGQAFACQFGDHVVSGVYTVIDGQVCVTCNEGTKRGDLGRDQPLRVAERLLAEIYAKQPVRGSQFASSRRPKKAAEVTGARTPDAQFPDLVYWEYVQAAGREDGGPQAALAGRSA